MTTPERVRRARPLSGSLSGEATSPADTAGRTRRSTAPPESAGGLHDPGEDDDSSDYLDHDDLEDPADWESAPDEDDADEAGEELDEADD